MSFQVSHAALREALEFVSFGSLNEHQAWIALNTGRIYWQSREVQPLEELPDDLDTSARYIAVPHKNELGLGRRLALSFTDQELPDDYQTVAGFFRHQRAYARFKELLAARGRLQRWYEYEDAATEEALREWCEENDLELVDDRPLGPPARP